MTGPSHATLPALGSLLRQIREARGLSQSALGRAVGVDHSLVSRWERGQRQPSLDTLRHLAVMLRLTAGERLALAMAALGSGDPAPRYASFDHGEVTVSCGRNHLRLFVAAEDVRISGEVSLPLRRSEAWELAAVLVAAAIGEEGDA